MAISIIGSTTAREQTDVASISITPSPTPTEGNLLVAIINCDGVAIIDTPASGWTLGFSVNGGTQIPHMYWRIVTGSETIPYVWTRSDGNETWNAIILELSGIDTTDPIDGTPTTNAGVAPTLPTSLSVTTSLNGALIIAGLGVNSVGEVGIDTGLAVQVEAVGGDSIDIGLGVGTVTKATAGATGAYTHSDVLNSRDWMAFNIAINPAAATVSMAALQHFRKFIGGM